MNNNNNYHSDHNNYGLYMFVAINVNSDWPFFYGHHSPVKLIRADYGLQYQMKAKSHLITLNAQS